MSLRSMFLLAALLVATGVAIFAVTLFTTAPAADAADNPPPTTGWSWNGPPEE